MTDPNATYALVATAALLAASSYRFRWILLGFRIQTVALVIAMITPAAVLAEPRWLLFAVYILALKLFAFPRVLLGLRARLRQPPTPRRSVLGLVALGTILTAAYATAARQSTFDPKALGAALATLSIGVLLAATRSDPLVRIVGLLIAESGFLLAALTLAPANPRVFLVATALDLGLGGMLLALRDPRAATMFEENLGNSR